MEYIPTFESYSGPMIASVMTNAGEYIVTGLGGRQITRRSIPYGEILVGFSTDLIVTKRNSELITFTPDFNRINSMTLASGDEVRGIVGPNILVYRKGDNTLITYDKNFRRITSYSVIQ
jgi:hypothetical protein